MRSLADRPIKKLPALRGQTVVNLFFEDSTRTRISFEAAAKRLSADVINFTAKGSSLSKGESLKDTALTLEAMGADAVVVRHRACGRTAPARPLRLGPLERRQRRRRHPRAPDPGAARRLHDVEATWQSKPGGLDGRTVAIVGDILHSRVARSNALLLRTLGAEVTLVAPPTLLPVGIEGWPVETSYDLDSVLPKADVVMMLRVQRERMQRRVLPDRARVLAPLRPRRQADGELQDHTIVMHPGPMVRGMEITADVADSRPLGDRRAGHQRRRRPDGRAVPAAGRRPSRPSEEKSEHHLPDQERRRPRRRRRRDLLLAGRRDRATPPDAPADAEVIDATGSSRCPAWSTCTRTCASRAARTPRP